MQLSAEQENKLKDLLHVFLKENAKLNLSAFRTEQQCWVGNILDSIAADASIRTAVSSRVVPSGARDISVDGSATRHDTFTTIDIGTGGGFPLLPLAILFPEISFTGLDATKKKMDAVQRMVHQLALPNVKLLLGRAEELGHDPRHREQYDVVLSRAVSELPTLLEFMSPFCKVGGIMLCWKSLAIEEELQKSLDARMKLLARLTDRHEYGLPGDWGRRQILIFEKVQKLPNEFPRRTGIPKKEPL